MAVLLTNSRGIGGEAEVKSNETLKKERDDILNSILADENVQKMKNYVQHGRVSTFDHCEEVARVSDRINELFHLSADRETMLKGAMLHDFYLYDWHEKDGGTHNFHGYIHADRADKNAKEYLDAGDDVRHVIRCHMWPLNLSRIPQSKEAWIVCAADKYVSVKETLFRR